MLNRVGRWLRQVTDEGLSDPLREEWECLSHPTMEFKLVIRHVLDLHKQTHLSAQDRIRFATRS